MAAAVEPLIVMLDDDFPFSRANASWALGYLEAMEALEKLEELKEHDGRKMRYRLATPSGW